MCTSFPLFYLSCQKSKLMTIPLGVHLYQSHVKKESGCNPLFVHTCI